MALRRVSLRKTPAATKLRIQDPGQRPRKPLVNSEVTGEPDEGRQYLSRRARVEALVLEHRPYYDRSFRGGVLTAIEFFSRSDENEQELLRQAGILEAGQDPRAQDAGPPKGNEGPPPRVNPETGPPGGRVLPGLQLPLHHLQRRGTLPRLHRPPTARERCLMSDQKNDLEYIRQYIQKHERYFEALGFQRPGGLPRYYTEQRPRGVAAGPGQGRKTEAGGASPGKGRVPQRPDRFIRHVRGSQGSTRQHQLPGRPGTHTRADSRPAQTRRGRRAKRADHGPTRLRPGCGTAGTHP